MDRRVFLGALPLSAVSVRASSQDTSSGGGSIFAGPPVVQHPSDQGFTVSFAVTGLATGAVEWGLAPDQLDRTAIASTCGLIDASDRGLCICVDFPEPLAPGEVVYYRVVGQRLSYRNAYELRRAAPEFGEVHPLKLPRNDADKFVLAMVNDTHENRKTLAQLHERLGDLKPDALLWCGDTCNDFDATDKPQLVTLAPMGPQTCGWASRQPMVFVPGNHDVRGVRARELAEYLPGWPGQTRLPYCRLLRFGPIALVTLDTGEPRTILRTTVTSS